MGYFKDLLAYQKGFVLAMEIFEASKKFPLEERHSLTDQIRRSSRSVCANFAEAYKRRKFLRYFILKLNDAEAENCETEVWLDFAYNCRYLSKKQYEGFISKNAEVGKLIGYMTRNPEKFL